MQPDLKRVGRFLLLTALSTLLVVGGCSAPAPAPVTEIDPSLVRAAAYAKSPYMTEEVDLVATSAVPRLVDVEAQALLVAKSLAPAESPIFHPEGARRFLVHPPEGSTFTYYAVGASNPTVVPGSSHAVTTVYAIQRDGLWAVWAEIVAVSGAGVTSTFVVARPKDSLAIATSEEFRTIYLGLPASGASQKGHKPRQNSFACDAVNLACEYGLGVTAGYFCSKSELISTLTIISCAASLFDDGVTIESCAIVLVEEYAKDSVCKLGANLIASALGIVTCDAAVGCGLGALGLGCDCKWSDPKSWGCDVACSTIIDEGYCYAAKFGAATVAGVNGAIDQICHAEPACDAVWDVGCGKYAEEIGAKGLLESCIGHCQLALGDPACGHEAQPCCEADLCQNGLACSAAGGTPICGGANCSGPSSQKCGGCGTQTRTCDNGTWSVWSPCLNDVNCPSKCGNGVTDPGETCDGNCPLSCDDGVACTTDVMTGSVATCDVVCAHNPIAICVSGDGCCGPGCTASNDSDCSSTCGNGIVEQGETCDGNCPASCNDGNACTADVKSGSPASCNVTCSHSPITACSPGDGCCPSGCNASTDSDCGATCGNGVVEPGEICDGNCPASCNDGNACTTDVKTGNAGNCDVVCTHAPVTACSSGDGCCPSGCNNNSDSDCPALCGNGVKEGTENCATCPADAPCSGSGVACISGSCVACGTAGQVCCAGNSCLSSSYVCTGVCTHCGGTGELCCSSGAPCGAGLSCNGSTCQPPAATTLFLENFELITWDQFGQGTLSDGISVWDAGGPQLRTRMGGGSSSVQSLTWYGGGVPAVASAATMTLPPSLDATTAARVTFEAFTADSAPMTIQVRRSLCAAVNVTVSNASFTPQSIDLPACGTAGKVVFLVGAVYAMPATGFALKIDNLKLEYP